MGGITAPYSDGREIRLVTATQSQGSDGDARWYLSRMQQTRCQ